MPTPAQKKKQYEKTPEYRREALMYSGIMLVVGLILSAILAFLIHRAESRRDAPPSIHNQEAGDVQEPSKEKEVVP